MLLFLFMLLSTALAAPGSDREAKVLRDDRVHSEGGAYSFDIETENGIKISEGGQPEGEAQAVHSAGEISFPLDNGEIFVLKYVANETVTSPNPRSSPWPQHSRTRSLNSSWTRSPSRSSREQKESAVRGYNL